MKWAGLLPFARLVESIPGEKRVAIDGSLLSCLVDRWRPETHTFHFRWGEMAPTLEDVSLLLWLFGKVMFTENHVTTISALYIPMALEIASASRVP